MRLFDSCPSLLRQLFLRLSQFNLSIHRRFGALSIPVAILCCLPVLFGFYLGPTRKR